MARAQRVTEGENLLAVRKNGACLHFVLTFLSPSHGVVPPPCQPLTGAVPFVRCADISPHRGESEGAKGFVLILNSNGGSKPPPYGCVLILNSTAGMEACHYTV